MKNIIFQTQDPFAKNAQVISKTYLKFYCQ